MARLKNQHNIIIRLVSVDDIVPIAYKPSLQLSFLSKDRDNKNLFEIEIKAQT
ncbi:MAG: hypothetical protein KA792_10235 [Bacteroidales bacterium]|nr:hypothetical protein [Bacteroidales bacterium]